MSEPARRSCPERRGARFRISRGAGRVVAFALIITTSLAQGPKAAFADPATGSRDVAGQADATPEDVTPGDRPPITEAQARWRIAAVVGATAVGVGIHGMSNWWQDGFAGEFRTVDEGWFDEDTAFGGADKMGHAFANYVGTRTLSWLYESLLGDRERALKLGVITTLGTYTAVEIIDGYSERWRFSKEDMVANIAGATLGYLTETHPAWDAKFDFRLHYRRSSVGDQQSSWDPLTDYSGQTFLIAVKASGFESLRKHDLLRYLEAAVGYNARGFETVDGVRIGEPSRHLYVGVSLNLSQILNDTVFRNHRGGRAQRITNGFLEFIQVPGTALAADHDF